MNTIFKEIKTNLVLTSLLLLVLGFILLLIPDLVVDVIGWVLGGILVLMGAINLIVYFVGLTNFSWYNQDFVGGVMQILFGLFVCMYARPIAGLIPLVFGIVLLIHGVGGIGRALEVRSYQGKHWIFAMILAVVSTLLGLVCIFNPFGTGTSLLRVIGACLIYTAVSDFITMIRAKKDLQDLHDMLKGAPKDYEDATFREIK